MLLPSKARLAAAGVLSMVVIGAVGAVAASQTSVSEPPRVLGVRDGAPAQSTTTAPPEEEPVIPEWTPPAEPAAPAAGTDVPADGSGPAAAGTPETASAEAHAPEPVRAAHQPASAQVPTVAPAPQPRLSVPERPAPPSTVVPPAPPRRAEVPTVEVPPPVTHPPAPEPTVPREPPSDLPPDWATSENRPWEG